MKLSVNPKITPDMSKQMAASMTMGWELQSVTDTVDSLIDFVRTNAYSTSEYVDGKKVKDSVINCYNIILDFDRGRPTYNEMIVAMRSWSFSAFIHTTRSHQKGDDPIDKFRIIIPLKEPISQFDLEALKEMPDLLTKLSGGYKGYIDMSTFQGSRMYVAAPDAVGYLHAVHADIFDATKLAYVDFKQLTSKVSTSKPPTAASAVIDENGTSTPTPPTPPKSTNIDIKSKKNTTFPAKLLVTKANQVTAQVQAINTHTSIFCPFCDHSKRGNPTSPNAFIDVNKFGMKFIYCSSEVKTFWQEMTEDQLAFSLLTKAKDLIIFREKATGFIAYADRSKTTNEWKVTRVKNNDYWMAIATQNNIPPESKSKLPIVEVGFDPGRPQGINLNIGTYNTFEPSPAYQAYLDGKFEQYGTIPLNEALDQLKANCPLIYFIMFNILGEDNFVWLMLNWLSTIFKDSDHKVDTYWIVISEEQGVGKDLFFIHVLSKLFGVYPQTTILPPSALVNEFNALDMQCWLRGYNEVFSGSKTENKKIKNIIKDKVTQKHTSITFKGADTFQIPAFTNYMFFSNNLDVLELDKDDRRAIVVSNTKGIRIANTPEFKTLGKSGYEAKIASEFTEFARIIFTTEHDLSRTQQAPTSTAKESLIKLSETGYERLATALRIKDYNYVPIVECFPLKPGEELTAKHSTPEGDPISDDAFKCISMIRSHGAIPASALKQVSAFLFGTKEPYSDILAKLDMAGLKSTIIRHNGRPIRAYVFKK